MKQIIIKVYPNGTSSCTDNFLKFDAENLTTLVTVDFSSVDYSTYTKFADILVGNDKTVDFMTGTTSNTLTFYLGAEHLKKGMLRIQPIARSVVGDNTLSVKWEMVELKVKTSINVLETDVTVTPTIAQTMQSNMSLFEASFTDAEALRVLAENGRVSAEGLRVTAEGLRVTAEGTRVSQENVRIDSENARNVFVPYNASTAYIVGNKVTYNGGSYRCKLASTGNLPTDTTYFDLIAGIITDSLNVVNTPSGGISATTAQDAINELDTKKVNLSGSNLQDESITINRTNFISKSHNRLNLDDVIAGYTVNSNGSVTVDSTRVMTGYIPVITGETLYQQNDWAGAFYDVDKVFISGKAFGLSTFTVPSGTKYYRTSFYYTYWNVMYVSTINQFEGYGLVTIDDDFLKEAIDDAVDDVYALSSNRFNPLTVVIGKTVSSSTGGLTDDAGKIATDYISVSVGEVLYQTNDWSGAFYDADKVFIIGKAFGLSTFTVPAGTKYYRTSFYNGTTTLNAFYVSTLNRYTKYNNHFFEDTNFISAIKNISNLKGLTWACIGDSLTENNAYATKNYHKYIAEDVDCSVVNMGVGGTGYIQKSSGNNNICDRIDALTGSENYDYITIFAGINDTSEDMLNLGVMGDTTQATIYGAIYYACDKLITKFPLKKIALITPTNVEYRHGINNGLQQISKAIKEVGNYFSIPVLDLNANSGLYIWNAVAKAEYFADQTHPNAKGHNILAKKIRPFLELI